MPWELPDLGMLIHYGLAWDTISSFGWDGAGAYSEKNCGIHINVDDLMEWIFPKHAKLSQTQEACRWEGSVWGAFSQEKGYGQWQIIHRGTGGVQNIEEV